MERVPSNPLLEEFDLPHGAVPFDRIRPEHFLPALEVSLAESRERFDEIAGNPEAATVENTLVAAEELNRSMWRIPVLHMSLSAAHGDQELRALGAKIWTQASDLSTRISTEPKFYERVRQLYAARESSDLGYEEKRLIEVYFRSLVRNGATLDADGKVRLAEIDREQAELTSQFSQNVLNDENSFSHHAVDEDELRGLPAPAVEQAAAEARERGYESGWVFTLKGPSQRPVLMFAENRELRERIYRARARVGLWGEHDNVPLVKRIAVLRHERAQLLGYESHADYKLEECMAETPDNVTSLLDRYREKALPIARAETEELRELARSRDGLSDFQPWDESFYFQKLKQERFGLDPSLVRQYFQVEKVVAGIMEIARRLYGVRFEKASDLPVYHRDVEAFIVKDSAGGDMGLLYLDLFARTTKNGGAWQGPFRPAGVEGGQRRLPVLSVVANMTPPVPGSPALLDQGEVTTLFHEMGHALHSLHNRVGYPRLMYPAVDFVELPSQLMENWVKEPEALSLFAFHHETGQIIPDDLVQRIRGVARLHGGRNLTHSLERELIDWAWHSGDPGDVGDVEEFERAVTEGVSLYSPLENAAYSPSFSHIFSGPYAAGYYSYRWAEALEADAFEAFLEQGIFSVEVATRFRDEILTKGRLDSGSILYERFRGRGPDPDALLRKYGLG